MDFFSFSQIHRYDKGLFDYQSEMKGALYEAWKHCSSVMCQMPTGTGKTHLLVSVVRDVVQTWNMPVWIVAHRIELIEQISATLTQHGVRHGKIISGSTVSAERVQVASIQTLASIIEKGKLNVGEVKNEEPIEDVGLLSMEGKNVKGSLTIGNPGLLVIDEAHHSLAATYQLLWKRFPDAYKLGMTATPCRLNKRGFTSLFDRLLTSWSISRFIEEGRLALFDYLSIHPQSEAQQRVNSLRKQGADGDYSVKEMGMVMDCPEAIAQLYCSYRAFAEGKKGIIYAIDRAHSRHICDYYSKQGVKIVSIDSKTPAWERTNKVNRYLSGEIDVMVNVDIFSEGFDCPAVEFIQLARPTLSLSKYMQQVGRGLRVHPNKVRTVILDQVGLYRLFGLPTEERNWQLLFTGKVAGKGVAMAERTALLERLEPPLQQGIRGELPPMLVVQGHEDFLQLVADRLAVTEPFERDGVFGLRKGSQVILPPMYPYIAPFTGKYTVITYPGKRYGILTTSGNKLPIPRCLNIELLADEFAYIEESPLVHYFLDLRNLRRYDEQPTNVKLDFLEFAFHRGMYYLRFHYVWPLANPVFRAEDLTIDGNVFLHAGYFIHRGEPHKLYQYGGSDEQGRLLIIDAKSRIFAYQQGKPLCYCGKARGFTSA